MNVVFINPHPGGHGLNEATVEPPLGLAYIAAVLEQRGFACSIIDANLLRLSEQAIIERIPSTTRAVGIYVNSFSYTVVKNLVVRIRSQLPSIMVFLGGPLPSAAPEMVLGDIPCAFLIQGEGEYAVLRIMENLRSSRPWYDGKISGLTYYDENQRLIVHPVHRIEDLDKLPSPAYHLLPPLSHYKTRSRKHPVGALITSRGCPFTCTFCSKDVFQRKVTFHSAEYVLKEIDFLVTTYHVKQIDILDDNFAQNRSRLEHILQGLIERRYGLALNLQSGIRTEMLDEALLIQMKKAGFYKLSFGIESVDEELLHHHRKQLDLHKVESVVRSAKRLGFMVYGFFIIGLPGETDEGFEQTLAFAQRMNFDIANFCMAIPFPGTELYTMVQEHGRFLIDTSRNIDSGFYDGQVFFEYGESTRDVIARRYRRAYKEFYSVRKQLAILLQVRSCYELVWIIRGGWFVLKGMLKALLHKNT